MCKKVKQIASFGLGLTYTPNYVIEGVPFISSKNISQDFLDLSDINYISLDEYRRISNNCKPQRGDILFTRVGSNLGHPVIFDTDENLAIFVSLGYLRVKININNEFVKHWMNSQSFWNQVKTKIAGSSKMNLNVGWLENFDIHLPTINSQKKIASFLNLIENRIITQKKIIEDLNTLIESISFIANKKNGEFYKVKDICNIGRGRVISTVEINKQLNPLYPVFSSQTQNNGIMGYLDNYEFDGEYITWTTDGANAGTIFYHNEKFNCTNVCGTLKVLNDNISAKYLSIILPYYVKKYVSKNLANPKLMNNTMANIVVKVIPISEQLKIVRIVSSLESKLNTEKSIIQLYIKQKEYLLNKLFI